MKGSACANSSFGPVLTENVLEKIEHGELSVESEVVEFGLLSDRTTLLEAAALINNGSSQLGRIVQILLVLHIFVIIVTGIVLADKWLF